MRSEILENKRNALRKTRLISLTGEILFFFSYIQLRFLRNQTRIHQKL